MKYSPSTKGFYIEDIHTNIPGDAVEVTVEQHQLLLDGQSQGKQIDVVAGEAVAVDRVFEQSEEAVRAKRELLLSESEFLVIRHRDQIDLGLTTSLTSEQYTGVLQYRQALRDITLQPSFPVVVWPVLPS